MTALDTTALSALLLPGARVCRAGTNVPIKHARERLQALVERIVKNRETLIVPAPVLSELVVRIPHERIHSVVEELNNSIWFRLEPFDSAAAIELGMRTAD